LAKLVEADFFANVKLDQNEHGAAERGVCSLGRDQGGQGFSRNFADRDCGFMVHEFAS
jgi:hypothetical protein